MHHCLVHISHQSDFMGVFILYSEGFCIGYTLFSFRVLFLFYFELYAEFSYALEECFCWWLNILYIWNSYLSCERYKFKLMQSFILRSQQLVNFFLSAPCFIPSFGEQSKLFLNMSAALFFQTYILLFLLRRIYACLNVYFQKA